MPEESKPELIAPTEVAGIQVNFCKNPSCGNYGVPATEARQPPGRRPKNVAPAIIPPRYKPASSSETTMLHCQKCDEYPPVKSNQGIMEELDRISAYLAIKPAALSCPNVDCPNNFNDISIFRKQYHKHTKTVTGSQRYKCILCAATFTDVAKKSTISRHKRSDKNASIFMDLVNKSPFNAIARTNHVSMKTLYDKIDFIYNQCVTFISDRERKLSHLNKKWIEIAVDRQVHKVNWLKASDKRNIDLYAIGSSDNRSGYVFGVHVNYDSECDREIIEADATACGDYETLKPFRKYAHLWLSKDYTQSAAGSTSKKFKEVEIRKSAVDLVAETYTGVEARKDVEACDAMDANCRLPQKGMQVHSEYTMYAHFMFLARQLKGVKYLKFYLDQDSGIRAACLSAFVDKILAKECSAFYVKISKGLSQAEKLALVNKWSCIRDEFVCKNNEYEEAKDYAVRQAIIVERMYAPKMLGKWKDRWLEQPYATMTEPEKMVCYLTNLNKTGYDHDDSRMAFMFDRASLHSIDNFFMKVRSGVSVLDRPVDSSSSGGRRYYGYSAYRPDIAIKLLEIFRVYHNYVQLTEGRKRKRLKDGEPKRKRGEAQKLFKSPAMRLGLASGPVRVEDILYYMAK